MSWIDDLLSGVTASGVAKDVLPTLLGAGITALGLDDPRVTKVGYLGGIPSYKAVREQVPGTYDPTRRPGSSGQRYLTDVQYIPTSVAPATPAPTAAELAAINAANPAKQTRMADGGSVDYSGIAPLYLKMADDLARRNAGYTVQEYADGGGVDFEAEMGVTSLPRVTDELDPEARRKREQYARMVEEHRKYLARAGNPYTEKTRLPRALYGSPPANLEYYDTESLPLDSYRPGFDKSTAAGRRIEEGQRRPSVSWMANPVFDNLEEMNRRKKLEQLGLLPKYAGGGIASMARGRYLAGATDGMADKVPARIEGTQEARLSDGEFVIPADVVSHLGNGNSDAGAKVLYSMMDRIRKARTGTERQGKQISPNKMLPS
jgi:hypothetical protein